jgi:hypothetical protein
MGTYLPRPSGYYMYETEDLHTCTMRLAAFGDGRGGQKTGVV